MPAFFNELMTCSFESFPVDSPVVNSSKTRSTTDGFTMFNVLVLKVPYEENAGFSLAAVLSAIEYDANFLLLGNCHYYFANDYLLDCQQQIRNVSVTN